MTTPTRPRGNPAALALGPGYLLVNRDLMAAEPGDLDEEWEDVDPGWMRLGYTETGSEFNYALTSGNVDVAEELDPVLTSTTGRTSTVAFTMAEMTASNLAFAMNGGMITIPGSVPGITDVVIVEPPDLGSEVRVMLGFESEDHTERWVYRKCFQTGTMKIIRQKGTVLAGIATTFSLEKPETGKRLYAAIFDRALRAGWNPDTNPLPPGPPTLTGCQPDTGAPTGGTGVTLTGTNLRGATSVTFDTTPVTPTATGTPDTTLQCSAPAHPAGAVDITVTAPAGTSAPLTGGFTYQ